MRDEDQRGIFIAVEVITDQDNRVSGQGKRGITLMIYQIYKDAKGEWRWRLIAANGRVIASSTEGYQSKQDCLNDIELVKQSGSAPVIPKPGGSIRFGSGGHGPGDPP
jgi:uncharacterized protein YegP (UPF0339 family)